MHFVDAEFSRERIGCRLIVARQHHDTLHALVPQHLHRVARRFAGLIGQGDDAQRLAHSRDEHCCAARGRKRIEAGMDLRVAEPSFLDQSMVADEGRLSANDRFGAAARNRLELRALCPRHSILHRTGQNRSANGMFRSRFKAGSDLQNLP